MADVSRTQGTLIGQTLGGYEVQTLIGRGAMGTVYLARDVKLNRPVALKVLLGSMAQTPSVVRQFQLEAQAAAPLQHPCVVRVYSAGIERGTPYMAMEFVDGEPLDRFLRRKGRLKWQQAFHVGGQVALALECAHKNNIVHRDVKPSNIMLDQLGAVRLTDFGIASIQTEEGSQDAPTFVGTPQYMSPEQCSNQKVGPASDLFSLGVTMFQMIAGELPFHGESSMALIRCICTEDPPRLNKLNASLPDDVARLVAYLLEKKPEMRPANAHVVYSLIERVQQQKGGTSAVPDALTSFLKEEMEPRPFANLKSSRRHSSKHRRATTSAKKKKRGWSARTIVHAAVVTVLALAALSVGPLWSSIAREGRSPKAPEVSIANFRDLDRGTTLAVFFAEGYRFRHVTWIGDESVLLVEAHGQEGSLTDGAFGIVAVDPAARRFTNIRSPWGPALDPDYWRLYTPDSTMQSLPLAPKQNPLADAVLVHLREPSDGSILTLAQSWDQSTPKPAVLFRSTNREAEVLRAVPKPDGITLCLVHQSANGIYLSERDVRAKPLEAEGARLTTAGLPIIPESVQYAPHGAFIAYLRETPEGERELWWVRPVNGRASDQRVVDGITSDTFSIRPDGSQIVVEIADTAGAKSSLRIVDVFGRLLLADIGPGTVSPDAWMPTGKQVMVLHGDNTDSFNVDRQLWLIEVEPPYKRTQVTNLAGGLEHAYSVSRDGRWAAAVSSSETFPTLAFVDLSQVGIEQAL